MYKKVVTSIALFSLLLLPGCKYARYYSHRKQFLKKVFFTGPIPDGPTTIFIHGTKESIISKLVHKLDYPFGIVPSSDIQVSSVLSRIAHHLSAADQGIFNRNHFYFYGWFGKLSFPCRKKAAERLYKIIKNHKGPLTIMAHSHGCNVALHLAELAEKDPCTTLSVEQLILIAPPVQEATKNYVHAPVFNNVYTFYSTSDFMQIGDPQGLYWESYAYTPKGTHIPLMSRRTFDPAPNIMQIRVLLDRHSPGHVALMLRRFISRIPQMVKMVKKRSEEDGYEQTRNFYIINIPPCGLPPEFLTISDIQGKYIPRSNYYKAKRKMARLTAECSIQN